MDVFPSSLKTALIVTAADGLLQGLLGALLLLMGQRAPGGDLYYLHYVYGAIVVFAIPVGYTYIGKDVRKATLVLSLAALILALAGTRGLMTGLGMA
jgi:heme A synthase